MVTRIAEEIYPALNLARYGLTQVPAQFLSYWMGALQFQVPVFGYDVLGGYEFEGPRRIATLQPTLIGFGVSYDMTPDNEAEARFRNYRSDATTKRREKRAARNLSSRRRDEFERDEKDRLMENDPVGGHKAVNAWKEPVNYAPGYRELTEFEFSAIITAYTVLRPPFPVVGDIDEDIDRVYRDGLPPEVWTGVIHYLGVGGADRDGHPWVWLEAEPQVQDDAGLGIYIGYYMHYGYRIVLNVHGDPGNDGDRHDAARQQAIDTMRCGTRSGACGRIMPTHRSFLERQYLRVKRDLSRRMSAIAARKAAAAIFSYGRVASPVHMGPICRQRGVRRAPAGFGGAWFKYPGRQSQRLYRRRYSPNVADRRVRYTRWWLRTRTRLFERNTVRGTKEQEDSWEQDVHDQFPQDRGDVGAHHRLEAIVGLRPWRNVALWAENAGLPWESSDSSVDDGWGSQRRVLDRRVRNSYPTFNDSYPVPAEDSSSCPDRTDTDSVLSHDSDGDPERPDLSQVEQFDQWEGLCQNHRVCPWPCKMVMPKGLKGKERLEEEVLHHHLHHDYVVPRSIGEVARYDDEAWLREQHFVMLNRRSGRPDYYGWEEKVKSEPDVVVENAVTILSHPRMEDVEVSVAHIKVEAPDADKGDGDEQRNEEEMDADDEDDDDDMDPSGTVRSSRDKEEMDADDEDDDIGPSGSAQSGGHSAEEEDDDVYGISSGRYLDQGNADQFGFVGEESAIEDNDGGNDEANLPEALRVETAEEAEVRRLLNEDHSVDEDAEIETDID